LTLHWQRYWTPAPTPEDWPMHFDVTEAKTVAKMQDVKWETPLEGYQYVIRN
jgi:hypothetical protein